MSTPINGIGANSAASNASNTPAAPSTAIASTSALANQDVFLQLLVAQLKNQDPEQPADGTAFVTQLAQFSTLGQTTQGTSDLDSMLKLMQNSASASTAAAAATAAAANAAASNGGANSSPAAGSSGSTPVSGS